MSWTSYGDDFTGRPCWDGVDHATRWHYLALVERCTRDRRWDGLLPLQAALRCSDVPDPEKALATLEFLGMVTVQSEVVAVTFIEEHIPPPQSRPDVLLPRKRANLRDHRQRKCDRGEHDRHCPQGCPERGLPVGKPVTPGTGTGTGRGKPTPHLEGTTGGPLADDDPWSATR